jgi:hypothetical protein
LISASNPFVIPDLDRKDLTKESVLAPVIVTTNVRKLALCNQGAAAIAKESGNPLYVIYARMQRSILGDASLFRRLCFYPQKGTQSTKTSARLMLTIGIPIMLTGHIGMGKYALGKGTIGHIVQFVFPNSVTFHQSVWEGANVHIPKPAPGTTETLICIVVRVYGREDEIFIPELGPGLILVFPTK